MLIVAKAIKGKEFLYDASTAYQVPKSRANEIVERLNRVTFQLRPGEVWHVYDVCELDNAYHYAIGRNFYFRRGMLYRHG